MEKAQNTHNGWSVLDYTNIELVQGYHVPFMDGHPHRHTTYDRPPSIRYELPEGNFKVKMKLHYKWMYGETETTQESSFIKTHFVMSVDTMESVEVAT